MSGLAKQHALIGFPLPGHVDPGQHNTVDITVGSNVGDGPHLVGALAGGRDQPLEWLTGFHDLAELRQHAFHVDAPVHTDHRRTRLEVVLSQLALSGGVVMRDVQAAIEHEQGVVEAVLHVGEIGCHRLQLARLVLKLIIDGHELFVRRLQFFVRGLQLFVGRLQFLVGGLQFLTLRLQFLVGCFQLFDDGLQVLTGTRQLPLQLCDDQVVPLILIIERQHFGGRHGRNFERQGHVIRLVDHHRPDHRHDPTLVRPFANVKNSALGDRAFSPAPMQQRTEFRTELIGDEIENAQISRPLWELQERVQITGKMHRVVLIVDDNGWRTILVDQQVREPQTQRTEIPPTTLAPGSFGIAATTTHALVAKPPGNHRHIVGR